MYKAAVLLLLTTTTTAVDFGDFPSQDWDDVTSALEIFSTHEKYKTDRKVREFPMTSQLLVLLSVLSHLHYFPFFSLLSYHTTNTCSVTLALF